MKNIIKTPSGLKAKVLFPGTWGPNKESAGLKYVGKRARARLAEVFTKGGTAFDLQDIVTDMKQYKFGYADGIELDHDSAPMLALQTHLLPVRGIKDNIPNCLWHGDNMLVLEDGGVRPTYDVTPITFLYPTNLPDSRPKRTGFAHPKAVADAYNGLDPRIRPAETVEADNRSIRRYADMMASELLELHEDGIEYSDQITRIEQVLRGTYTHMNAVTESTGQHCMHWLRQKRNRLMLLMNDGVVHANDLILTYRRDPRQGQDILRRMLPSAPWRGFNRG